MIETLDDVCWSDVVVPGVCSTLWRQAVQTVHSIVDQVGQIPVPLSLDSIFDDEEKDLQQDLFDMTTFLYVSKQVAKLFPASFESQVVLRYSSDSPGRVLVSPWMDNLDVVDARDGFVGSWQIRAKKYWRESGWRRDGVEIIKWFATFPAQCQRLFLAGWITASLFSILHYIGDWIEWTDVWFLGIVIVSMTMFASLIQQLFQRVTVLRVWYDQCASSQQQMFSRVLGLQGEVQSFPIGAAISPKDSEPFDYKTTQKSVTKLSVFSLSSSSDDKSFNPDDPALYNVSDSYSSDDDD